MPAHIDQLESRLFLTTAAFKDAGMLTVDANPGDDVIVVKLLASAVQITVNSETPLVFNLTSKRLAHNIRWLRIDGLAGNDHITVDGPIGDAFGMEFDGGDGNDFVEGNSHRFIGTGGAGDDTVRGTGDGLNELEGDGGNDTIICTNGHCVANGGSGRDLIQLAGGDDSAWGGPGSDTIQTGGGNDTVLGGRGDDVIDGGDGNDWLFGQRGNDSIIGGTGDDHLFGQDGSDSLSGGSGNDVLFTGDGSNESTGVHDAGDIIHGREYRQLEKLFNVLVPGSGRPT